MHTFKPSVTRKAVAACATLILALAACGGTSAPATSVRRPATAASTAAASTAPVASSAVASGNAVANANPKLQAIIDGARKEGKLTLTWGENNLGGATGITQWTQGLNKKYGLNLHVQFVPGNDMTAVAASIVQDQKANQPSPTDIYSGQENSTALMVSANALESVDWAALAPNIKPQMVGPNGVAVEVASNPYAIMYNSSKLTGNQVPKSMQDLLKPEYKGRIASTPYAAGFDRLAMPDMWGLEKTTNYVKQLSNQISGLIRCGEMQRIVSGEFDMLALDCGDQDARIWQRKGAPIKAIIPSDAAGMSYLYMSVPKNAAHPNAAKLFITYMLSPEGQRIMFNLAGEDHYLLTGSETAPDIQKMHSEGVKFYHWNLQWMLSQGVGRLTQAQKTLQKILKKQ